MHGRAVCGLWFQVAREDDWGGVWHANVAHTSLPFTQQVVAVLTGGSHIAARTGGARGDRGSGVDCIS